MKQRKGISGLVLTLLIIFLTACGSAGTNNASSDGGTAGERQQADAGTEGAGTGPITIKHDKGELKLDKPAVRVVSLDWLFTESLVALGMQPVGNAENEEYKNWMPSEAAVADDVMELGIKDEPDLEAIVALKPDLIIAGTAYQEAIYDQLNAIAPTIMFTQYPADGDQYTRMMDIFNEIAAAVGKTEEAEQYVAGLNQHYEEAKAKLAAADQADLPYLLIQGRSDQNAAALWTMTETSMAIQTLDRIGLQNVWKPGKFEQYGYTDTGVEQLIPVQDATLLSVAQQTDDVFNQQLTTNSVWNDLAFVKENRHYALDGSTWLFGGPISAKVLVDEVVKSLQP
ncbi:iron-siderophore ABC transporter substrate-binding protein [Paenibacillus sp. P96]|uniref:Iron-siderophore ABC transporter substrate-binding protein n=1 Tax=Paenibacillus zeirhizosphaerae TaxID=2987519 RepID=A0ABT9FMB6_9BACL|nr:iron-siderophore ABC transporter substrate-binding protein [Paenibacillus sp. P96]MDP4095884.1 iron-siderophore ABC transporter substrate-binding protein [Paenibacillus sp. P96]